MTRLEEDTIDYWCASFPVRRAYPMTLEQRAEAASILIDLTEHAETKRLQVAARATCLGYGIVKGGVSMGGGSAA